MIGCTQPRRIAARAVARRVAEELQTPVGGAVGFQVRFNDQVGDDTRIKFMTDGILLAEIQSDRWLSAYDTIIVDEAHERSLNIDFLLGYLKQLLRKRRDLKVIVTSATIDTERFAAHFDDAPVIDVEGRSFPVEVRYRPLEGEATRKARAGRAIAPSTTRIVAAIDEITARGSASATCWCSCRASARSAMRTRRWSGASTATPKCCRCTRGCPRATRTACSIPGPQRRHRAGDQRRRDLADRAAHPLRGRSRASRASSATARGRSSTACTSSRCRRPAPTSARAAAAALPTASATACTPKPISQSRPEFTDPEIRRASAGRGDPAHAVAGPGRHRGLPVPGTAGRTRDRRRLAAAGRTRRGRQRERTA